MLVKFIEPETVKECNKTCCRYCTINVSTKCLDNSRRKWNGF